MICGGAGLDVYKKLFGGVVCSGYAIAEVIDHNPDLVCSGQAEFGLVEVPAIGGGIICSGSVIISFSYFGHGGAVVSGSLLSSFQPGISGGVVCGGTAVPQLKINLKKTFSWNIGNGIAQWYRIEGDCKPRTCPPLNDPEPISPCPTTSIVNLMARSTNDLFRQLTDMNFAWPISTIKRFSTPALISETPPGLDTTCNNLVDITSKVSVPPQYANFFVEEDLSVTIGVKTNTDLNIVAFIADSSTPMSLSGSASYATRKIADMSLTGTTSITAPGFTFTTSGGLTLSGNGAYSQSFYALTASGGMSLSGAVPNPTNSYHFTASGGMSFSGTSDFDEGGTLHLDTSISLTPTLDAENAAFAKLPANTIAAIQTPVIVACCPLPMPATISLVHNLDTVNGLSQFLARNGQSFPTNIPLIYSPVTNSWQGNLHYVGLGFNIPEKVSWSLTFEFSCVTTAGIVDVGSGAWKASIFASYKNLQTSAKASSRILLYFSNDQVCENVINFTTTVNVSTLQVSPTPILAAIVDDDAQLFNNATWKKHPILKLNFSPAPGQIPTPTVTYPEVFIPVGQPHSAPP